MEKKECPGAGAAAGARSSDNAEKADRNSQTAPATQAVYVLRLQSPRGEDIRRLRLLLKRLLRRYELRCLSVEEEPQP
jgi:hypothetical protein